RQDPFDLRLLEHHLGDEDAIGVARFAPWQRAAVTAIPREQSAAEPPSQRRIRKRRRLLAPWHGAIIGDPCHASILEPAMPARPGSSTAPGSVNAIRASMRTVRWTSWPPGSASCAPRRATAI